MVIDGESQKRAGHRVVGAERDEAFTPVPHRQLTLGNRRALEVEHSHQPEMPPATGVEGERRLDDADLAKRHATRHDVRSFERQDGVGPHPGPRRRLGRHAVGRECRTAHRQDEAGSVQSDWAAAAGSAARLARRKSRFMMVMVSMLICLGQAS